MSDLKTNRRMFLKVSGIAAGAAALAACGGGAPAPTAAPPAATATSAPAAAEATATTAPAAAEATATTAPAEATAAPTAAAAEATTAAPAKYNEAPMLAEMVAAGKLPPVDQRLPKNPLIVTPTEQVGKYSGVYTWCNTSEGYINSRYGADPLVFYGPDATTIEPNVAESWETSADGLEWTFHLREGVRWSDGEPYTADDIMFVLRGHAAQHRLDAQFPRLAQSGWRAGGD